TMSALSWLLSITLLSSLLIAVQTVSWQGLYSDPRHPGKCTINPQLVLNPGVSVKDPMRDCGQIVCGHMGQVAIIIKMWFVPKQVLFLFGIICSFLVLPTLSSISINSYLDPDYPGNCVIDVGSTVVLLKFRDKFRLKSLPCTEIFCIGDGYGMLYTCEKKRPPPGCRFAEYTDLDAEYPTCCKRKVVCH
ncbi:hypothetical protein KR032_006654, partial [Drosophila birchii]